MVKPRFEDYQQKAYLGSMDSKRERLREQDFVMGADEFFEATGRRVNLSQKHYSVTDDPIQLTKPICQGQTKVRARLRKHASEIPEHRGLILKAVLKADLQISGHYLESVD
ncbi:hypothetical protein C8R43DRAFT_952382 [Mycena crocata]|nr:hypothetical protein C8R43DRAFT_957880 [Mycena crocata]KAJ7148685.1 hypothetical protein C8R43DRAFT_952382 [Mycena crocata]